MNRDTRIVLTPFNGLSIQLLDWARLRFANVRVAENGHRHYVVRNREVRRFFRETDLAWLLFLSGDMVWTDESEILLHSSADVAGCRYVARSGRESHRGQNVVSCGCIRISRRILASMDPPYFLEIPAPRGQAIQACSCAYFCEKARQAGASIERIGTIGHQFKATFYPGKDRPRVQFRRSVAIDVACGETDLV